MNSTSFIQTKPFLSNSTVITTAPWFIPVDILFILSTLSIILLSTILLFIGIFDRKCHTVSVLLVVNSSLTVLVLGCVGLSMSVFTLHNDLKRIEHEDSFCVFRAYLGYASYGAVNYSFVLQALYRYICVVHRTRSFYQSFQFQGIAIAITWLISLIYPLPFLFTGHIIYNVDNQICQQPLRLSFYVIYGAIVGYILPISLIGFLYFRLVGYVKTMGKNVNVVNLLVRARRELKMARRLVILVAILLAICFPFTLIMLMAFFNRAPMYHFRIAYIFVDGSVLSIVISLFQFTEPVKNSIKKKLTFRLNTIGSRES